MASTAADWAHRPAAAAPFAASIPSRTPSPASAAEAAPARPILQGFTPLPAGVAEFGSPAGFDRRPLIVMRGDSLRTGDARRIADVTREALAIRPDARFDVVAITANRGGDPRRAQRARDSVARTLVEAGAAGERIDVSAEVSTFLPANEVHVFLR